MRESKPKSVAIMAEILRRFTSHYDYYYEQEVDFWLFSIIIKKKLQVEINHGSKAESVNVKIFGHSCCLYFGKFKYRSITGDQKPRSALEIYFYKLVCMIIIQLYEEQMHGKRPSKLYRGRPEEFINKLLKDKMRDEISLEFNL